MLPVRKKMHIINRRGQKLASILCHPGPLGFNNFSGNRHQAVVVVCHGFAGTKEGGGRAVEMGLKLADLGFSTLLFDFSGCGESEGKWEDITLTGQINDLADVVGWCRKQGFQSIILNGRSFGGSTAISYTSFDQNIAAVCSWAAVARPVELFSHLMAGNLQGPAEELIAVEGEAEVFQIKRRFFDNLRQHDIISCAASISPRPLLIIHGKEDQSVPVDQAVLLYEAAEEPKKLVIIEGADHRFSEHMDIVWKVFFQWLQMAD